MNYVLGYATFFTSRQYVPSYGCHLAVYKTHPSMFAKCKIFHKPSEGVIHQKIFL